MLRPYSGISVAYIVVRDVSRKRDFEIPPGCVVTDDVEVVLTDSTVDVVVELMGGTDKAWAVVRRCLEKRVNVVTANKALISKYLTQIESILASSDAPPFFLYEAAVCGGIPVVNALLRGMNGDELESVYGVMNGSTNWMLDRMDRDGVSYDSLLVEAKHLGYLEADPSADIMGWDARSKLCILARIAFGTALNEDDVQCLGIDSVTQADITCANARGCKIKLLARSWKSEGKVHAFVMPSMVPSATALGSLPGATNCVCFEAKRSGSHCLIGSGAGRYPTANSVVSDILEIHKLEQMGCSKSISHFGGVTGDASFDSDFSARFFVRAVSTGGVDEVIKCLQGAGVGIQHIEGGSVITAACFYRELKAALTNVSVGAVMVVL